MVQACLPSGAMNFLRSYLNTLEIAWNLPSGPSSSLPNKNVKLLITARQSRHRGTWGPSGSHKTLAFFKRNILLLTMLCLIIPQILMFGVWQSGCGLISCPTKAAGEHFENNSMLCQLHSTAVKSIKFWCLNLLKKHWMGSLMFWIMVLVCPQHLSCRSQDRIALYSLSSGNLLRWTLSK